MSDKKEAKRMLITFPRQKKPKSSSSTYHSKSKLKSRFKKTYPKERKGKEC